LQDSGVISTEVYICQRVTCFTEFSEKSPEFKGRILEGSEFSTIESVENVENFLPPKTCISSKNVSNQGVDGQVINNPNVENVENCRHCGKLHVFSPSLRR
jgi:hypothetical protein